MPCLASWLDDLQRSGNQRLWPRPASQEVSACRNPWNPGWLTCLESQVLDAMRRRQMFSRELKIFGKIFRNWWVFCERWVLGL